MFQMLPPGLAWLLIWSPVEHLSVVVKPKLTISPSRNSITMFPKPSSRRAELACCSKSNGIAFLVSSLDRAGLPALAKLFSTCAPKTPSWPLLTPTMSPLFSTGSERPCLLRGPWDECPSGSSCREATVKPDSEPLPVAARASQKFYT